MKWSWGVAPHQQPVISRAEHHYCVVPQREMERSISSNARELCQMQACQHAEWFLCKPLSLLKCAVLNFVQLVILTIEESRVTRQKSYYLRPLYQLITSQSKFATTHVLWLSFTYFMIPHVSMLHVFILN